MQNLNNKASILLWSVFLSLFISALFFSISTKIGETIKENSRIKKQVLTNNEKEKNLKNSKIIGTIKLTENEKLYKGYKNNFVITLKKDENFDLKMIENSNLTIETIGEPILKTSTGTTDFLLKENKNIFVGSGQTLKITNLGGIAKIKISSKENINFPYYKYKVTENIAGKEIEKEVGTISNF